jgi:flagellar hook-associated protein 3 FlgL
MSIIGVTTSRVTQLMQSNSILSQIDSTESQLQITQNQLSTGERFTEPGSDPGDAAIVMQLNRALDQQNTYQSNLSSSASQLGQVDSSLGDLNTLLVQANAIASQNVGSEVSASARQSAATVVESLYSQALSLSNTQFEGQFIFGGDKSNNPPFVSANGGVQFVGSNQILQNTADANTVLPFQVTAASVFGALSSRVTGSADLTPSVSGATRVIDLRGATSRGAQLGTIQISNGTTTTQVDLSQADNVQDVVDDINKAAVGGITASISGNHLVLNAGAADNISVTDVAGGTTAASLGIAQSTGVGAGVNLTGTSLQPSVTVLTPISALNDGAGIDTTHGFTITNGGTSATISLAGVNTVGDLLNKINESGTNVQAQIDPSGTGIDILNPVQGTQMSIAENGGTTASDLGIRSFTPSTPLSELNDGQGVGLGTGGPDFQITRSDGTSFGVSLSGAKTIQDVITAINTADAGGGVTASFATTGNGIVLTDTAGGPGTVSIASENFSTAVKDLGLDSPASGNVIAGTDVDPVETQGVFADLAKLRDALNNNDQTAITAAAQLLTQDQQNATDVRGQAGALTQQLQSRQDSLSGQQIATKAMISQLQDADYASTITKFTQLQTALQATLMTAAKTMSLSLIDFLT